MIVKCKLKTEGLTFGKEYEGLLYDDSLRVVKVVNDFGKEKFYGIAYFVIIKY
ncbi:hypothetical protein [Cetobacterium sp.]|uniref:hypothetical protein n=1 Tax=Cetobacterium sp. TaxID=2071632 RepID=UPI003F3909F6